MSDETATPPAVESTEARTTSYLGPRRVGVFGGTFDPVHYGHLAAAEEAWPALHLAKVLFVPNWQQPLKRQGSVSPGHRLAMVELAIAGNERFEASDVELRREGPSYT